MPSYQPNLAESLVLPISIYAGSEWQCSAVKFISTAYAPPAWSLQEASVIYVSLHQIHFPERLALSFSISTGSKCHLRVLIIWLILMNGLRSHFQSLLKVSIIYVSSHPIHFAKRFALPFFWLSLTYPYIWLVPLNGLGSPSWSLQKMSSAYVSLHRVHFTEQLVLTFSISTNSEYLCVVTLASSCWAACTAIFYFYSCRHCLRVLMSNSFCWMACTLLLDLYSECTGSECVITLFSFCWTTCATFLYLYRQWTCRHIDLIICFLEPDSNWVSALAAFTPRVQNA
jgi:hypothetical protein